MTVNVGHGSNPSFETITAAIQELQAGGGGGGSETLAEVLTNGNDAGGQDIVNVGDISMAGLTGATAGARFVGGTTAGAPTAGTFTVGDFVIDQSGAVWICTTAGTPGTWVNPVVSVPLAGFNGAGYYSLPQFTRGADSTSTLTLANGSVVYVPLYVWSTITLTLLAAGIVTGTAGALVRLGLYGSNTNGMPHTLLVDAGTVDASAAVSVSAAVSQILTPGTYWVAVAGQGTANPIVRSISPVGHFGGPQTSLDRACGNGGFYWPAASGVTGTFPATATVGGGASSQIPIVGIQIS